MEWDRQEERGEMDGRGSEMAGGGIEMDARETFPSLTHYSMTRHHHKFNAQNLTHIHTLYSLVVAVTLLTTMKLIKHLFKSK